MKIREGFIIREVAGNHIAVATGEASKTFNSMITINETGKFLFELLQKETTSEELVSALIKEYEIDKETATADVSKFVNRLQEAGVFE